MLSKRSYEDYEISLSVLLSYEVINDNVYLRKFSWIYNGISNPTLIAIKDCDRVLNIENHSEKYF